MAHVRKQNEPLLPAKSRENCLRLFSRHPRIEFAVQMKDRTAHMTCILDWIVLESVEAVLGAAPENQQPGKWKRRRIHGSEAILDRRKQTVKRRFDDQNIRLNAVYRDSAKNRRAAHRLTVQAQRLPWPFRAGERDSACHIVSFVEALPVLQADNLQHGSIRQRSVRPIGRWSRCLEFDIRRVYIIPQCPLC
jgi:hypothetical protein